MKIIDFQMEDHIQLLFMNILAKVKLHEGFIDSCLNYLCNLKDIRNIWTYNDEERITKQLKYFLKKKDIRTDKNWNAYWYIKEGGFRKRLIYYWIEITMKDRFQSK